MFIGANRCIIINYCGYTQVVVMLEIILVWSTSLLSVIVAQSNEVGGSYYMEKEGLNRSLQHLKQSNVSIKAIVTDRHTQINKWLREQHPEIKHYYDVWHIAKGEAG